MSSDIKLLVTRILDEFSGDGIDCALQGSHLAFQNLENYHHCRDIDIWTSASDYRKVDEIMSRVDGIRIIKSLHKHWLSHLVYVCPCNAGLVQIDITVNRLMVGPAILHPQPETFYDEDLKLPRLAGTAAIADLILRPLARRGTLPRSRLGEAIHAWSVTSPDKQQEWTRFLDKEFGKSFTGSLVRLLHNDDQHEYPLAARLKVHLVAKMLQNPRGTYTRLFSVIRQKLLAMLGRTCPFGRPTRGVLVALLGSDGSGKSTLARHMQVYLSGIGYSTRIIYMGRGRGNLPGIESLRNFLAAGTRQDQHADPAGRSDPAGSDFRAVIFRAGSWYYTFENMLRGLWLSYNKKILGRIVICDRYIYDLYNMKHASYMACKTGQYLAPRPDFNIYLKAPINTLLSRKQERTVSEIEEHNRNYENIIRQKLASVDSLQFDTSILNPETLTLHCSMPVIVASHDSYSG